jgi:rsbT antagonist protein RsbS
MEVPILKQGSYLIASIQSALSDAGLIRLQNELAEKVGKFRSRGVIVDLTALDVMDSFATRMVRNISQILSLRGAETIIVGIQPEVAFAMTELGLTLEGVQTALDLEEGLSLLDRRGEETDSRGGRKSHPGRV